MYFKMNNATSGESTEAWNLKEIRELQKENPEKIKHLFVPQISICLRNLIAILYWSSSWVTSFEVNCLVQVFCRSTPDSFFEQVFKMTWRQPKIRNIGTCLILLSDHLVPDCQPTLDVVLQGFKQQALSALPTVARRWTRAGILPLISPVVACRSQLWQTSQHFWNKIVMCQAQSQGKSQLKKCILGCKSSMLLLPVHNLIYLCLELHTSKVKGMERSLAGECNAASTVYIKGCADPRPVYFKFWERSQLGTSL